MGTLSSLTGGGSGGGGGDPSGKFQASATVANGDLVVLNDNGTVAPVTSVSNTRAVDQTFDPLTSENVDVSSSRQALTSLFYTSTQSNKPWLYLYQKRSAGRLYYAQSNAPSSNHDFSFQSIAYNNSDEFAAAQDPNDSGRVAVAFKTSNDVYLVTYYHDGTDWLKTNPRHMSSSGSWGSSGLYVGFNDDGTIAVFGTSSNDLGHGHANYAGGSSTSPTRNIAMASNKLNNSTMGFVIDYCQGVHLGGSRHLIVFRDQSSTAKLFGMIVTSSSTGATFHTPPTELIDNQSTDQVSLAYDKVNNIGVIAHKDQEIGFRANTDNTITKVSLSHDITKNTGDGYYRVKYNPITKRFIYFETRGNVSTFALATDGTVSDLDQFYHTTFPSGTYTSTYDGVYISEQTQFAREFLIFISQNSTVGLTSDRAYLTSYSPAYVDTNIDNHFGEAKEAIASGAAGSVGILNRTKDILGSSFQKGQKLFANPSGTALATSGTYRVGHATDGDTVLVLGDPS